ncbi:MAG: hypothetical protein AAF353_18165, partial [Pseudomonadota bacterium]
HDGGHYRRRRHSSTGRRLPCPVACSKACVRRAEFQEESQQTVLDAGFDILKGAFRFTSQFFRPLRPAQHRVDFSIGAVTAGVRGTDIWGRSADDEDFVALIEGSIEVSSAVDAPRFIDQPLTLYRKAKGLQADAPQPVTLEVVQSLAPETELDADAGIASTTGEYQVVMMSLKTSDLVDQSLTRFRAAGYAATTQNVMVGGQSYTRILLPGLVDRDAAAKLGQRMESEFQLQGSWISKI